MAIFNSYVKLPEGKIPPCFALCRFAHSSKVQIASETSQGVAQVGAEFSFQRDKSLGIPICDDLCMCFVSSM